MATLRNLIDGKSLDANATDDVFNHLKNAKKAKLKNDMANIKLQTKLAPTRQLIQLVDQEHPMPGQMPGQQQVDQNGNPVNLQNPQMDQNGNPIPNQAPPMKPGIGQPNVAKGNQNIPQKKPGFPNANKTSTKDKLANDKNKKQVGGKKGVEIHVKAGGPGSGRRSEGGEKKLEYGSPAWKKSEQDWAKKDRARRENERNKKLMGGSKKIDQLNVKKKKMKGQDYHDDAGMSQMPSRGVGLSGGGPGSGRKPGESTKTTPGHYIYNYTGRSNAVFGPFKSSGNAQRAAKKQGSNWGHIQFKTQEDADRSHSYTTHPRNLPR